MFHWLFTKFLSHEDASIDRILLAKQLSGMSFVASAVADSNIVMDWMYYRHIWINQQEKEQVVPDWLFLLQLKCCIIGTFSWLTVATNGRVWNWIQMAMTCIPILLVSFFLGGMRKILQKIGCTDTHLYHKMDTTMEWMDETVSQSFRGRNQPILSNQTLLLLGILMEDIPQMILVYLIETQHLKRSSGPILSNAALMNINVTIIDILHKLAKAFDMMNTKGTLTKADC